MKDKISLSLICVLVLSAVLVAFRMLTPADGMLSWDVFGYYLYLPAKFIYHNLSLSDQSWLKGLMNTYDPSTTLYQAVRLENDNWVIKYSMGLAVLYAPFFFIGHLIALQGGYPADGLSLPYQYSVTIGGLFFAIIGLFYFRRILRKYFNEWISAIIMVLIFAGTNYFQLTAFGGTLLSSNFLFTLYAMLIWYSLRWHEKPCLFRAVLIGILCGLIILIRPSEIVCLFIPLLWGISGKTAFKEKWKLFRKYFLHLLIIAVLIFLVFLPQLLYWKNITGHYLYYSYTNPGEGFEFLWPYTFKFLFSFRKGWLIYTPLMIFAIVGFISLYKRNKSLFPAVLLFFIFSVYIISSWSCWWYAGASFSSRSLVPAYVILAIPLGYLIEDLRRKKTLAYIAGIAGILLIILNLFQTWQFQKGILPGDRITRDYYMAVFGKTSVAEDALKLLMVDRSTDIVEYFTSEEDYTKKNLCALSFEDSVDSLRLGRSGAGAQKLNGEFPYSSGPDVMFGAITMKDHAWIRAGVWIYVPETYNEPMPILILSFHHNGQPYKYRAVEFPADTNNLGKWTLLQADYLTPEVRSQNDNLKVYVWHRGQADIWIDDLVVDIYEPLK